MMVKGAKALEVWARRATEGYPGVDVVNMSGAWRDGLAFCAIIHRYRPELIDFAGLEKTNVKGNNAMAFKIAEEKLGIPHLLDAEDMVACETPDRLSILTYVSEFYHKFKTAQPRGSPMDVRAKRAANAKTEAVRLSRTASASSSGVSSVGSSCTSSASSVCDSPPPTGSKGAIQSLMDPAPPPPPAAPEEPQPVERPAVVVRREQSKLAARRMVKSMYVESSSVKASSPSPPSPIIESENPFRDAMLKFSAIEKENKSPEKRIVRQTAKPVETKSQSTETLSPKNENKATQTSKKRLAPFKSCLKSQLSCPADTSRHSSNPSLSYTSTPRPYTAGLLRAGSVGQSLNQSAMTARHATKSPMEASTGVPPAMSASYHGESFSSPSPSKYGTSPYGTPSSGYNSYATPTKNCYPYGSPYATPASHANSVYSTPSSGYSSAYSTPTGIYGHSPAPFYKGGVVTKDSRHIMGLYSSPERLALHIEGRSSLV